MVHFSLGSHQSHFYKFINVSYFEAVKNEAK